MKSLIVFLVLILFLPFVLGNELPIEEDNRFPLEVIDCNLESYIKVKLTITEAYLGRNIPIYVIDKNTGVYYYKSWRRINRIQDFRILTLPFGHGMELHWGKESTVVRFPEPEVKSVVEKEKSVVRTKYSFNSKDTEYSDGTHNLIIGGQRYADDQGTKIEDAPSLKDCQFCHNLKLVIDYDFDYPLEVLDYNLTSIDVKLETSSNKLGKRTDIKVLDKYNKSKKYFKTWRKINKMEDSRFMTLPFGFDKEVHWGQDSTTILLEGNSTSGWGVLENMYFDEDGTITPPVVSLIADLLDGSGEIPFIKFNITQIPSGSTILNATLGLNATTNRNENLDVWYSDNQTWLESTIDTQCGDGTVCQVIWDMYTTKIRSFSGSGTNNVYEKITDLHSAVQTEVDAGRSNLTFILNATGNAANFYFFATSYTSTSPFLNITYLSDVNLTIFSPTTDSPQITDNGTNETFSFYVTAGGVNQTSGVDVFNVTANGTTLNISQTQVCEGTLDCSVYTTEDSCNNCSQCEFTSQTWINPIEIRVQGDVTISASSATSDNFLAMSDTTYIALANPGADGDHVYSTMWFDKELTNFSVKHEDDSGSSETVTDTDFIAIQKGVFNVSDSFFTECSNTGSTSGETISLSKTYSSSGNYSIVCTPEDDNSDTQQCGFSSKSGTTAELEVFDDTGASETTSDVDWCAFTVGNWTANGTSFVAGLFEGDGNTPDTITFPNSFAFPDTNYAVKMTHITVSAGDMCSCEIDNKQTTSFRARCEDDDDGNCMINGDDYNWIAISEVNRNVSLTLSGGCANKDGGGCVNCSLSECDTNCSDAGCTVGGEDQTWYDGTVWKVNVTMPNLSPAFYDLNISATYSNTDASDVELRALNHSAQAEVVEENSCTPTNGSAWNIIDPCNISDVSYNVLDLNISCHGYLNMTDSWVNSTNFQVCPSDAEEPFRLRMDAGSTFRIQG